MARWRLTGPHYLNVPGTEWEHKEISTDTGRQNRKVFKVPRLLDPNDPGDQNREGDCVVCWAGKGEARDIIFEGDPTPDMTPLDAEAEKVTERCRPKWEHPIESLPVTFTPETEAMMKSFAGAAMAAQNQSVSRSEFDAMKAEMAALKARNAELEKKRA